jgi:hypothetical protein
MVGPPGLEPGTKGYEQLQEIKTYINQQVTRYLQGCGSKCGTSVYSFRQSSGLLIRGSLVNI